jgi:hypothetical protein
MLSRFYKLSDNANSQYIVDYISLLFKNLIRFIGDDFIPRKIEKIPGTAATGATQRIKNGMSAITILDSDDQTVLEFASRFANESLSMNDNYTKACVSEFLNLHNGLYAVNLSNKEGIELELEPQQYYDNLNLSDLGTLYVFPVDFTFGTINFIVCI